jgi:hypothetical protein
MVTRASRGHKARSGAMTGAGRGVVGSHPRRSGSQIAGLKTVDNGWGRIILIDGGAIARHLSDQSARFTSGNPISVEYWNRRSPGGETWSGGAETAE